MKSKYLDKLKFNPSLESGFFWFFIKRTRLVYLILIIIIISWLLSLRSLPLESSPEVKIWIWWVITILPWASPETIEDLITKKLEKEISKIKWIDKMTSTSKNSMSNIVVQFKSDANITDSMRELKDKVDFAKKDLPTDAQEPIVKEFSLDDSPIWVFAISWKYDWFTLYEYGKKIKEELERNPLVSEVTISWWDEVEFLVNYDPKKLDLYNLTSDYVNNIIKSSNFTMPIWEYDVAKYSHTIKIDERFYTINELENLIIWKIWNTWIIYLKDVAEVKEMAKKRTSISRLSYKWSIPNNAVTLSVVKKLWGSIVSLVEDWNKKIDELRTAWSIPNEKELIITTIQDNSELIKTDLKNLTRDWILTVFLVFIILFLIIWIKPALVAWISAPLVFLMTFTIMSLSWQTLNFLSMFALILSLWLLVDDAIVIISAINQYKQTWKFTTKEAAILVLRDFKKVLISTTLTVVWIFSAMLFMTWIIWKFIFSIPFIITTTLLSSLVIALTINPALAVIFDKPIIKKWCFGFFSWICKKTFISLEKIELLYERNLEKILDKKSRAFKFLLFVFFIFILAILLPITGILKSDFFPRTDQDLFFIDIESEAGTRLEVMSEYIKPIEEILIKEKDIQSFTTIIWSKTWWWNKLSSGQSSGNVAWVNINLIKKTDWRKETSMSIADRLRNTLKNIKNVNVTVSEIAWWPPTWSDFEIKIAWADFEIMNQIWEDFKKILSTIPWVINIDSSRKPVPLEFSFSFNKENLAIYDLSLAQVWVFIKWVVDWVESTKILKWKDEIIVRTKYDNIYTNTLDKIKNLKIKNNKWQFVYIRDLLDNKLTPSTNSITRIDQKRIIIVSAWATQNTTWKQILSEFNKKTLNYRLPSWYELIIGWANEENQKSVESLLIAIIYWLFLIIITLVILYDSFKQSFLVLITIPLSLIWVFFWLTLFGQPLSFPGLIWLVALFWIVVRNGIILFDKINVNIKEWIEFKESIIDAVKTRLEPVFLTSICTVFGLIPLTFSNPMWTSLWLSIMFGLIASTFFTLLVLPVLYFIFVKEK